MEIRYFLLGEEVERKQLKGLSGIYEIRFPGTNHLYVGSAVDLNRRLYNHIWNLSKGTHRNKFVSRVFEKYSEIHLLVVELVCEESLIPIEQTYIDYYGFTNLMNMCPIAGFGDCAPKKAVYQISQQDETIIKHYKSICSAARAIGCDRCSITQAINTFDKSSCGFRWATPDFYKDNIEEYKKEFQSEYAILSISLTTSEILQRFKSVKGTGLHLNKAINKPNLTSYKRRWCYEKDYESLKNQFDEIKAVHTYSTIYQLDRDNLTIIREFDSVPSICEVFGVSATMIYKAIRDINVTSKGYRWCLAEKYESLLK